VVLDIGVDAGALVVYAPRASNGAELEIRRRGMPWRGEHTGVRERHVLGGACFAGVFGSLPGGTYDVRLRGAGQDPGAVLTVEVREAAVTEATFAP
jgi:hypothetical protein